jgi:hypothetical protein
VKDRSQTTTQNADLSATERLTMETALKKAEEKARLAQQNAD